MTEPVEIIDELAGESLREGQTKREWLDYLLDLRAQLDMTIEGLEEELG